MIKTKQEQQYQNNQCRRIGGQLAYYTSCAYRNTIPIIFGNPLVMVYYLDNI